MRAVIQRVTQAGVCIENQVFSTIKKGLLILAGFEEIDNLEDLEWMAGKIARLRIFDDSEGVMNLSCNDVGGEYLVVSQFTLFAATKKGNRPSYIRAAKPEIAVPLYEKFLYFMQKETGMLPKTGKFGADMQISLINSGPVTILIDTKNKE